MLKFYSIGYYSEIHLSTQALKGLGGCLLDLTKDLKILHKLLCLVKGRLKNTQHCDSWSSQNSLPATQQHTTPAVWGLYVELSSPLSQHMSGRVCLSPVCLPLWQQQGNVSALPNSWHHKLRCFPETHCHIVIGPCHCNEKAAELYMGVFLKKENLTLSHGL